jgi:hypothetical protein
MKASFYAAALVIVPTSSATEPTPWPPEHKAAAIAGCRASIADLAERDYLKRSQLTELPPDFREKAAPAMEPFLAVCNCVYDHFERLWTFEYYVSHHSEVTLKLTELTAGACAVPVAKPSTSPESQPPLNDDA